MINEGGKHFLLCGSGYEIQNNFIGNKHSVLIFIYNISRKESYFHFHSFLAIEMSSTNQRNYENPFFTAISLVTSHVSRKLHLRKISIYLFSSCWSLLCTIVSVQVDLWDRICFLVFWNVHAIFSRKFPVWVMNIIFVYFIQLYIVVSLWMHALSVFLVTKMAEFSKKILKQDEKRIQ